MTALQGFRLAFPSQQRSDPTLEAFVSIVDRIESLLDEETQGLRENAAIDFAEISRRKRQGLLELSRTLPQLLAGESAASARRRLAVLRAKIERNRVALDIQLRAVREVADIIERTMRDAESDGTYSDNSAWQ